MCLFVNDKFFEMFVIRMDLYLVRYKVSLCLFGKFFYLILFRLLGGIY